MENKEFAEKLMQQLDGLEKQKPSPDFLAKMEEVALRARKEGKVLQFNSRSLMQIAAAFLFLVFLNGYAIIGSGNDTYANNEVSVETYDLLAIQNLYDE
ncbi:MAG: hypothetical protein Sapg2KO_26440 [Saprospiraceae bacterium]